MLRCVRRGPGLSEQTPEAVRGVCVLLVAFYRLQLELT